jgi:hypothetical protein
MKYLISATIWLFTPFLQAQPTDDNSEQDAGRYKLHSVSLEDGKYILFRIDSKSGRVWQYDPNNLMTVSDDDARRISNGGHQTAEEAKKVLIEQAFGDEGTLLKVEVYLKAVWRLIPDVADGYEVRTSYE